MAESIKPFRNAPYTQQHNYVYDKIMRELSANAYKVLSTAIRLTTGWHRGSTKISYSQFQDYTGIVSRTTIHRAIKECIDRGYLARSITSYHKGTNKPIYSYSLVQDYTETIASPENGLVPSPENGLVPSPENGLTKEKKKTTNKKIDDVVVVLSEFGIGDPWLKRMAEKWDLETATTFVHQVRANPALDNPQGYLVERFRAGDRPLPFVANTARNGEGIRSDHLVVTGEEGSGPVDPLPEFKRIADQVKHGIALEMTEATFNQVVRPLEAVAFEVANSKGLLLMVGPSDCTSIYNHRFNGRFDRLLSNVAGVESRIVVKAGDSME